MTCDLCGRNGDLVHAIVEGTMVSVCKNCSDFGNIIEIKKSDPKKIIKAADLMPIPNQKMAMGIQARGGMGRTISTSGLKSSRSTLDRTRRNRSGARATHPPQGPDCSPSR